MKHHIIYISGLGDHYDGVRRACLFFWRFFGVEAELAAMKWYNGRPYNEKLQKIRDSIERAQNNGQTVSLIGESAGASIAMNAFATDKSLNKIISLCGVNNGRTHISKLILEKSPAFEKSIRLLPGSQKLALENRRNQITSVTGLVDRTVPVEKNIIPGVEQIKIWFIGHIPTIFLCLTLGSFVLIREIKK